MSRIFISYARADVEFARKLARSLSEMGAEVWLDVNDIPAGMKWSTAIQQGLNLCQVMLLIISPESMTSNNVEDEWQYYLDKQKPVIPLWYRPADKHFQISRLQHIDFHALSYAVALDHLLRELQGKGVSVEGSNTTAAPLAWIDIAGKGYSLTKYPVTNAQFAKFIEANGYKQQRWWTEVGWEQCQKDKWTEPRYWTDTEWNGTDRPVVGVSWYEAVAFCLWLGDTTGENIVLPSDDQWQYAAQGDDGRVYPWGNDWDGSRCNNNVDENGIGKTTTVREYEGQGDSPFGVVDMVGNVWEWCLTDYDRKTNDVNILNSNRVIRGGSWYINGTISFRCDYRNGYNPSSATNDIGFRLARI